MWAIIDHIYSRPLQFSFSTFSLIKLNLHFHYFIIYNNYLNLRQSKYDYF